MTGGPKSGLRIPVYFKLSAMVGVGAFLGWLALRGVGWKEIGEAIGRVDSTMVGLSVGALIGFYAIRAVRWALLLRWRVSPLSLFRYSSIGYLVSSVAPLQMGELVKPAFLKKRHEIGYVEALTSVGAERLLDGVVLVVFAVVGIMMISVSEELGRDVVIGLRAASVVALLGLGLMVFAATKGELVVVAFERSMERIGIPLVAVRSAGSVGRAVFRGLAFVKQPKFLIPVLLLSVIQWLSNFASVYLIFTALDVNVRAATIFLGFAVVSLGLSIPLSPGYLGQYEALWILIFAALVAEEREVVASLGILSHAVILGTIAVLGIGSLVSLNNPFGVVREFSREVPLDRGGSP